MSHGFWPPFGENNGNTNQQPAYLRDKWKTTDEHRTMQSIHWMPPSHYSGRKKRQAQAPKEKAEPNFEEKYHEVCRGLVKVEGQLLASTGLFERQKVTIFELRDLLTIKEQKVKSLSNALGNMRTIAGVIGWVVNEQLNENSRPEGEPEFSKYLEMCCEGVKRKFRPTTANAANASENEEPRAAMPKRSRNA